MTNIIDRYNELRDRDANARETGPTRCGALTIPDTDATVTLDPQWAVHRGAVVTGLITSTGRMRWSHAGTVCLTCGQTVGDHVACKRA